MKQIYSARNPTDAHLVKGLLESNGIACCIKGEALYFMRGGIPATSDTDPSVWIYDETQLQDAEVLLEHLRNKSISNENEWTCSSCGETLEIQFTNCWSCGYERE